VIVYNLLKFFIRARPVKNLVIIFASLLVLLTVVNEHTLIVLSILSLLVFLSGKLLQRKKSVMALASALIFIIVLYCIRNYPFVQNIISESIFSFIDEPILSVQKLGISYILFRYVHWLVESYRNTIRRSDFLTFLSYIFFFPNFLFAYVFKPSLSLLNRLLPRFPRMPITVTGYLFTFFICGLWHGDTINFVYWGLWHGVGLSIGKLWKVYIKLPDRVQGEMND
jgi:D-alanyl-lipoteichoic acid acyltransferase DltB (MBOAT superfamily)